jgi:ABC-type dipeptide/oligopeptide/nickel transport system permease component
VPPKFSGSIFSFSEKAPGFSDYPPNASVTPEKIDELRVQMGADKPLHIRYLSWLRGLSPGRVLWEKMRKYNYRNFYSD